MNMPDVLPGDLLLSSSPTWLSKAIRFFEKLQTGSARESHAGIILNAQDVIEALWVVRINPLTKYQQPGQDVRIYRLPLSTLQRVSLQQNLLHHAGDSYGWTKLPLFALDGVASWIGRTFCGRKQPVFWFTKKLGVLNVPVCSQFVVYALDHFANAPLLDADAKPIDWRIVSPDYLDDLLQLPTNRATLLYDSSHA